MALQELRPVELGWEDIRESAGGEQQRLMLGKVWEVAQSVQELKLTGKELKEVREMMQFVHGQKPMLEDERPPLRHPHVQRSSRPDSGIGSGYEEAMTNYGAMQGLAQGVVPKLDLEGAGARMVKQTLNWEIEAAWEVRVALTPCPRLCQPGWGESRRRS
jgi:hypothetical protein